MLIPLLALAGCSSQEGLSGLFRCEGVVTFNSDPVAGAMITFHPSDGARGAGAITDSAGRFRVTTLYPEDGIAPGTYRVTITRFEEYGPELPQVRNDEGEMIDQARPLRNILPARYANPNTSDLSVTIEARRTTLNFDLVD